MTRARRWAVPGTSTCTQINADRPLGTICPVATSATLGSARHSADAAEEIRKVAAQVFGTAFDKDSVVGEDRYRPEEFIGEVDYGLPIPHPKDLAAINPDALPAIATAVLGNRVRGRALGRGWVERRPGHGGGPLADGRLRAVSASAAAPADGYLDVMYRLNGAVFPISGRIGRWLLLGTAVLQASAPPLIGFDSAHGISRFSRLEVPYVPWFPRPRGVH